MAIVSLFSLQVGLMLGLFALAMLLFSTNWLRVDVAAMLLLCLLVLLGLLPNVELIPADKIFSGFSSNAVVALIGVFIIGEGLQRSGVLNQVVGILAYYSRGTERRAMLMTSAAAGLLSGLLQNIGAAALFAPVVVRLSRNTKLSRTRLMMPMAFAAITGGTITTIGSSPLILLHDLLPPESGEKLSLFYVTPLGLGLLAATLIFFALFSRVLLPIKAEKISASQTAVFFQEFYSLDADIYEIDIPELSPLIGRQLKTIERAYRVRFIGVKFSEEITIAPAKDLPLSPYSVVAVMGVKDDVQKFVRASHAHIKGGLEVFAEALIQTRAGVSELIVPPDSSYVGKSIGELNIRQNTGLAVLAVRRDQSTHYQNLRDFVLKSGDLVICHSSWKNLSRIQQHRDLAMLSNDAPNEEFRPHKARAAILATALALFCVLATPLPLPIALLCGAMAMLLGKVIDMDEAYRAISWKTIFLLAGLIPMGIAAEHSGMANWLGVNVLYFMGDLPANVILVFLCLVAMICSLTISNVGATVLLVPIAINIAYAKSADPLLFGLAIAISATNAFILPTHPVNVLTMGAGGYHNRDYLRVGVPMSILFFAVGLGILLYFY